MKTRVNIVLMFLTGSFFAGAQTDSSFLTTYYRQKLSLFNVLRADTGSVIFLGDSITDIAEWGELFKSSKVKNRGVSGDVSLGVLNRLTEVTRHLPAKVFIMIGINDIANNLPDSSIVNNIKAIIQRIQKESPVTKIFVQSILPTNNRFIDFKRHQDKQAHIVAVNNKLQQLAAQNQLVYIDLYSKMLDGESKLDTRYTNDGLHLTAAGYMVWMKELLNNHYLVAKDLQP
ncbi:MAG: lysophospholipase L1-like esterase [Ferruginibacter sp.]|nr:lysophospholipase L1-like esterase [Ferruginibacter sp.]